MSARYNRNSLEELRAAKRRRPFYRLASPTVTEHEYRKPGCGPSSYAFVKFECAPADELSFTVKAAWPSVPEEYGAALEHAIAEGIADVLLDGLYQHTGCAVTLVEVRFDQIGSSEAAFMMAAREAMQDLLKAKWTI